MSKAEFGPVLNSAEISQSRLDEVCGVRAAEIVEAYNLQPQLEALKVSFSQITDFSQQLVFLRSIGFPVLRYTYTIPAELPDLKVTSGTVYPGTASEGAVFGSWYASRGNKVREFNFRFYVWPLVKANRDFETWWQTRHPDQQFRVYQKDADGFLTEGVTDQATLITTFCEQQCPLDMVSPYSKCWNPWTFLSLEPGEQDDLEVRTLFGQIKRSITGYTEAIDRFVAGQKRLIGQQVWS